jgi:hypothetical protein
MIPIEVRFDIKLIVYRNYFCILGCNFLNSIDLIPPVPNDIDLIYLFLDF